MKGREFDVCKLHHQGKGGNPMPVLFAITGTALLEFAEGVILGANVYLASRGVRNTLGE